MAKKFPPKSYDSMGDPTRTETTVPQIRGAGRGQSFKKDDEKWPDQAKRTQEQGKQTFTERLKQQRKESGPQKDKLKQEPEKDNHE